MKRVIGLFFCSIITMILSCTLFITADQVQYDNRLNTESPLEAAETTLAQGDTERLSPDDLATDIPKQNTDDDAEPVVTPEEPTELEPKNPDHKDDPDHKDAEKDEDDNNDDDDNDDVDERDTDDNKDDTDDTDGTDVTDKPDDDDDDDDDNNDDNNDNDDTNADHSGDTSDDDDPNSDADNDVNNDPSASGAGLLGGGLNSTTDPGETSGVLPSDPSSTPSSQPSAPDSPADVAQAQPSFQNPAPSASVANIASNSADNLASPNLDPASLSSSADPTDHSSALNTDDAPDASLSTNPTKTPANPAAASHHEESDFFAQASEFIGNLFNKIKSNPIMLVSAISAVVTVILLFVAAKKYIEIRAEEAYLPENEINFEDPVF